MGIWILLGLVLVVIACLAWAVLFRKHDDSGEISSRHSYISEVGHRAEGGGVLTCPFCGGTQFAAKRSAGAKVGLGLTIGLGALLAPKTRVKCITCGKEFLRG